MIGGGTRSDGERPGLEARSAIEAWQGTIDSDQRFLQQIARHVIDDASRDLVNRSNALKMFRRLQHLLDR